MKRRVYLKADDFKVPKSDTPRVNAAREEPTRDFVNAMAAMERELAEVDGQNQRRATIIERLTRERDAAMNANMAKIAPFLPALVTGSTVAADTPAPMSYGELFAYANLLVEFLTGMREALVEENKPRLAPAIAGIDAMLARNPRQSFVAVDKGKPGGDHTAEVTGYGDADGVHITDVKVTPAQAGVWYLTHEGQEWRPWTPDMQPKPPRPEDAPFYGAGQGMAQWPVTGVHFLAIRFGDGATGRVWDARRGWRKSAEGRE